jgi:ABC-type transport system involved in multi-copper enzyme maturation permease subunit
MQWRLPSVVGDAGRGLIARAGGPILDKELRVDGRRRLTYVLRIIYVAVMAMFVVGVWGSLAGRIDAPPLYRQMQMARVGAETISVLLWFQFFALQLVAGVLLAGAIGDEIVRRTLDVLLATPITSFQIVAGKLASRLLNLLLMAALSLPVMLVIRVMGGVSAWSVVGGTAITLTAALFVASVSLYFSAGNRRPWLVILKTGAVWVGLFGVVPLALGLAFSRRSASSAVSLFIEDFLTYTNPVGAMASTINEGVPFRGTSAYVWPVHCGVMLLASAVAFVATVRRVTRVALQQLIVPEGRPARGRARKVVVDEAVRRVSGQPMIWKEMRHRVFSNPTMGRIMLLLMVLALVGFYALTAHDNSHAFDDYHMHVVYIVGFMLLGSAMTTTLAAVPIASEKEARTWGQLLATPMTEREILLGKAVGVWRRSAVVWSPLIAHLALFLVLGKINPIVVVHIAMIVCGVVVVLTGTGLYFSAVFKSGTRAVFANIVSHGFLWIVVFVAVQIISRGSIGTGTHTADWAIFVNPLWQAGGAAELTGKDAYIRWTYDWWGGTSLGPYGRAFAVTQNGHGIVATTLFIFFTSAAYSLIGLLFMKLAARRIRAEKT